MKRVIATGLVLSLFAGVAAIAQPQSLNVNKTQNPLGQPLVDARGFPPDDVMIEIPLRPDDQKYAGLRGAPMKAMVEEIAAISRRDRDVHGNIYWGRNAGSQGHVEAEDWTVAKFNKLGLTNVHKVFAPPLAMWQAKSYDITFAVDAVLALISTRQAHIARRHHGRDRMFVNHLADGILEQNDKLIERFDLALQFDTVDQVNGYRDALLAQRIQVGFLK